MKVVTICGSMKFKQEMKRISYMLEADEGYCVIQCTYGDGTAPSSKQISNLTNCHFKKIDISDAIYVVNINNYIGEATRREIEYAKSKGKEVIYHIK